MQTIFDEILATHAATMTRLDALLRQAPAVAEVASEDVTTALPAPQGDER